MLSRYSQLGAKLIFCPQTLFLTGRMFSFSLTSLNFYAIVRTVVLTMNYILQDGKESLLVCMVNLRECESSIIRSMDINLPISVSISVCRCGRGSILVLSWFVIPHYSLSSLMRLPGLVFVPKSKNVNN